MSEENFKGKNALIWGLGRYEHGSGAAAVRFFIRQGAAKIFVSDLQPKDDLQDQIDLIEQYAATFGFEGEIDWGGMGRELKASDLKKYDVLVPNPAVPVSKTKDLVKGKDIQIESEMTLFFARCPKEKIIGVTGTRGKSTTTALIHHILNESGKKVALGGNIAKGSPLDILNQVGKTDYFVLELSNFMLEYLDLKKQSPHVAVLLNVLPDHLSRYAGDMNAYADVKAVITKYQDADDILVCNFANEYSKKIGEKSNAEVVWVNKDDEQLILGDLPLKGEHNVHNVKAALACVEALGVSKAVAASAVQSFSSLEGRLQLVGEARSVQFYNDTTSTTPVAALAALKTFEAQPLVLIAGGADKGLAFDDLAQYIAEHSENIKIVWLFKDEKTSVGGVRFKKALKGAGAQIEQHDTDNMFSAVEQAYSLLDIGGLVLLSPACSSFDLFKNEFDRGDQFNSAVKELMKIVIL